MLVTKFVKPLIKRVTTERELIIIIIIIAI